jgi:hypothetical protein
MVQGFLEVRLLELFWLGEVWRDRQRLPLKERLLLSC